MKKSKTSKRKRLLIVAPVATGILMLSISKSEASVFDPIKQLWNSTTQTVSNTFDRYLGGYLEDVMEVYIPQGIDAIFGALGLPDIGQALKILTEEPDWRDIWMPPTVPEYLTQEGQISADTTSTVAEVVFSVENQEQAKQLADASTAMAQTSVELAQKCADLNITQEIMKCMTAQQANQSNLTRVQIAQNQELIKQLAAANLANANTAKALLREERQKQAEKDLATQQILDEVTFSNALIDDLTGKGQ